MRWLQLSCKETCAHSIIRKGDITVSDRHGISTLEYVPFAEDGDHSELRQKGRREGEEKQKMRLSRVMSSGKESKSTILEPRSTKHKLLGTYYVSMRLLLKPSRIRAPIKAHVSCASPIRYSRGDPWRASYRYTFPLPFSLPLMLPQIDYSNRLKDDNIYGGCCINCRGKALLCDNTAPVINPMSTLDAWTKAPAGARKIRRALACLGKKHMAAGSLRTKAFMPADTNTGVSSHDTKNPKAVGLRSIAAPSS